MIRAVWLFVGLMVLTAGPAAAGQTLDFVIMCSDSPVGKHQVDVERSGDETHVHVAITLDISLGPIPLYHYRHDSREIWHGERLIFLESRTDDNGEAMTLSVRQSGDDLLVQGKDGTTTVPGDVIPTSYWNSALVSSRPLLDSQSGRLLNVARVPLGSGRWRIQGDLNLTIAYSPEGVWSGLSFRHSGEDFTYVRKATAEGRS